MAVTDIEARKGLMARARAMRQEGMRTGEIARALCVSQPTASAWTKGVLPPNRQALTSRKSQMLPVLERLYREGRSIPEIARITGVPASTVRLRTSLDMKLARECCFERDNYACRSCGKRGGQLNAHHIWPFQKFPNWKFEVWNLVTLCKHCHHAFHKAAGGHVRVAIGPFFSEERNVGQVREPFEPYELAG